MVTTEQLIGLSLACFLLIVVPGPSVLFVVGRALSYGRGVALAGVAGNTIGTYLVAVLVALGIGPLLEQSVLLFNVIRLAGAAYLVWLGISALRHGKPRSKQRAWLRSQSGHRHADAPFGRGSWWG